MITNDLNQRLYIENYIIFSKKLESGLQPIFGAIAIIVAQVER